MLKLFNTKNKKKEYFSPIQTNKINIYVCGVTVYDACHIGHGRTFVVFDMIIRYFRYLGYNVNYIRNITDIDDKIILKAFEKDLKIQDFTKKIIKQMHLDFNFLNILPPNSEPRVTNYIDKIIEIIEVLLKKKYAYISYSNFDILFSIKKDVNYGILSNQYLDTFKKSFIFNTNKNNFFDFVLWKQSKLNEPGWLSPWGFGRPGWHIECTALNNFFFKNHIDIHGGGVDLIFPHHENELSQSMAYNKKYIIKYWMHSGMLILKNKKMSKSLKNTIYLKKVFKKYHGETLRYFFLLTHYRKPIFYNKENIKKSFFLLKKLYKVLNIKRNINIKKKCISSVYLEKFINCMNDDFNTPKVLKILTNLSKKINILKKKYTEQKYVLITTLKYLGNLLGLFFEHPHDFLNYNIKKSDLYYKKINYLINKRNIARKKKNWLESDFLRDKLIKMGVNIQDSFDSSKWYVDNT
ncbi:cysteine--tRNA ligase [Buchnera aphidicola (Mollitrichosiphum nigrofasciatum)]|uniref:cysteine--tRNA ligase n=1 Tax=Buchnera aphidicola TaxID=9 RepID=UPI0031B80841